MIPIKNAREIEKMRQACRTASDVLDRVRDLVRPGITTKEVDEAAADFMSEAHVNDIVAAAFLETGAQLRDGKRAPALAGLEVPRRQVAV